jgi:LysM repeat protein
MSSWREIGSFSPARERVYRWVAFFLIILSAIAYLVFFRTSIFPQVQTRTQLGQQLEAAEVDLAQLESIRNQRPTAMQEQIQQAQQALQESSSVFLTDEQTAAAIQRLYRYAGESNVEILSLQNQARPEPTDLYQVQTIRLQVAGPLANLLDFGARIEDTAYPSYKISSVHIAGDTGVTTLAMEIVIYTSDLSAGADMATPVGTPGGPAVELSDVEAALDAAWVIGDWERAISFINQIRGLDPQYPGIEDKLYTAHVNFGTVLLQRQAFDAAAVQFNLALDIKPDGPEALAGLQQTSVTPTPTLSAEQQIVAQLHSAWATEDWDQVLNLLQQLLASDPDNPDYKQKLYAAYVNQGYQLAGQNRLEEAKEAFVRALAVQPGGEEAEAGLAVLAGATYPSSTPEPEFVTHVVQRGDTLFSLSRQYGTTVEAIRSANGLVGNNIRVGQELRIPLAP